MKHYLIIQDTHFWDTNISCRKNYALDSITVYNTILKCVKTLRKKFIKDEFYVIFLGDVFHRGLKNEDHLPIWVQNMTVLRAYCDDIYFVVGNHELSFPERNPFWSLFNHIDSENISQTGKIGKGVLQLGHVKDYIDVNENARIVFGHHGTNPLEFIDRAKKMNFLMAHQYWLNDPLYKSLEQVGGTKLKKKYMTYHHLDDESNIKYFRSCHFGHMHELIGTYDIRWEDTSFEKTRLHYSGSLSLTNRAELRMKNLTRKLWLLSIDDNDFYENAISIELPKPEVVLDLKEEERLTEKAEHAKEKQTIRKKVEVQADMSIEEERTLLKEFNPVVYVEEHLITPKQKEMFEKLESGGIPEWLTIAMQ